MELIQYDNQDFHNECFKCLQCKGTLSLAAVAMINGDLYCKTCFKKIFLKEGKYTSFQKTPGARDSLMAANTNNSNINNNNNSNTNSTNSITANTFDLPNPRNRSVTVSTTQ